MRLNDVGIFLFFVNCALVNNFIFSRFLGNCPYLGVSNKLSTATGMGIAVTFVMGLSSLFAYIVYTYLLVPLELQYLETIAFILIIAALVQFVEMFMKNPACSLQRAGDFPAADHHQLRSAGRYLVNIKAGYNMIESVLSGVFGALGFCWPLC